MELEFNGEKKTTKEWALEIGLAESTIRRRLQKGWDVKKVLTTPPQSKNQHTPSRIQFKNSIEIKEPGPIEPEIVKVEPKHKWSEKQFKVMCGVDKPHLRKVTGLANKHWGIYEKPYGRRALIHLPTGKRVGRGDCSPSVEQLKELVEIIDPMFDNGKLPQETEKVYEITYKVQDFFETLN